MTTPTDTRNAKLAFQDISKRYANGVLACEGVGFSVAPQTVHAIVGENGAGKSTLVKLVFGLEAPSSGQMWLDGQPFQPGGPAAAQARGIGLVPQHLQLLASATVAENILLGCEPVRWAGQLDRAAARARVQALSARYGLAVDPDARVGDLAAGAQQRVAILKALRGSVSLLLMDEPTALLAPHESDALFTALLGLRQAGLTVVLVSHKLAEVRLACSRCTVMRGGRVVAGGAVADFTDAELGTHIIGRPLLRSLPQRVDARGRAPRLQVRGLSLPSARGRAALQGIDLDIAAGEVLAIAGVEGNGQNRLAEVLTGLHPRFQGQALLDGAPFALQGVAQARARGVGSLPEDRLHGGVAPGLSVADNQAALDHAHPPQSQAGWLNRRAIAARARAQIAAFGVRAAHEQVAMGSLSGGNMQKLVVARELAANPRLLVAAQPTRGVDLGAAQRLRQALREARDAGCAVLLISADIDELFELPDRLAVMYEGRLVAHLQPDAVAPQALGRFMTGLLQDPQARATLDAPFTALGQAGGQAAANAHAVFTAAPNASPGLASAAAPAP